MSTTEEEQMKVLERYQSLLDEELSEEATLQKVEELFTPEEQKIITDHFLALPQPQSEIQPNSDNG